MPLWGAVAGRRSPCELVFTPGKSAEASLALPRYAERAQRCVRPQSTRSKHRRFARVRIGLPATPAPAELIWQYESVMFYFDCVKNIKKINKEKKNNGKINLICSKEIINEVRERAQLDGNRRTEK